MQAFESKFHTPLTFLGLPFEHQLKAPIAAAIVGVASDFDRMPPYQLRSVSQSLATQNGWRACLPYCVDAGDLAADAIRSSDKQRAVERFVARSLANATLPVMVSSDPIASLATVRCVRRFWGPPVMIEIRTGNDLHDRIDHDSCSFDLEQEVRDQVATYFDVDADSLSNCALVDRFRPVFVRMSIHDGPGRCTPRQALNALEQLGGVQLVAAQISDHSGVNASMSSHVIAHVLHRLLKLRQQYADHSLSEVASQQRQAVL